MLWALRMLWLVNPSHGVMESWHGRLGRFMSSGCSGKCANWHWHFYQVMIVTRCYTHDMTHPVQYCRQPFLGHGQHLRHFVWNEDNRAGCIMQMKPDSERKLCLLKAFCQQHGKPIPELEVKISKKGALSAVSINKILDRVYRWLLAIQVAYEDIWNYLKHFEALFWGTFGPEIPAKPSAGGSGSFVGFGP